MRFSKKILAISLSSIFIFTIACFVFEFKFQQDISEPLISNFFKVIGSEIAALAFIKITESIVDGKVKKEEIKNSITDDLNINDLKDTEEQINEDNIKFNNKSTKMKI